jgi:hypothetical protein
MNQFTTLEEKIKKIIAEFEERQNRMDLSQSGYRVCGDVVNKLKAALNTENGGNPYWMLKPRKGRPCEYGKKNRTWLEGDRN